MPEDGLTFDQDIPTISYGNNRKRALVTDADGYQESPNSAESEKGNGHKRLKLHIDIPAPATADSTSDSGSVSHDDERFSSLSPDSLFDEALEMPKSIQLSSHPISAALRAAPPIPGLFFDPSVQLPAKLADQVAEFCMGQYFDEGNGGRRVNQIMLFERANDSHGTKDGAIAGTSSTSIQDSSSINAGEISPSPASSTGLPPPLLALLDTLSDLLNPKLPIQIHKLLFPSSHTQSSDSQASLQARQAILNLYAPGEGISPHVDLLRRFGDGIIGVSLCGGCVMRFERVPDEEDDSLVKEDSSVDIASRSDSDTYDVYLPRNSIIILTGDARYKWTHGIERRDGDWVSSSDEAMVSKEDGGNDVGEKEGARKMDWIPRSTRLSITFRWLLPGADVVGGNAP